MKLFGEVPGERLPCRACDGVVVPVCPSCGEQSRYGGGRCDECIAAARRVVATIPLLPPREREVRRRRAEAVAPAEPGAEQRQLSLVGAGAEET
jgi:hypothetical protein